MKILGTDPVALALTLGAGSAGGFVAKSLHLPLGYLLGSLLTTGLFAAMGWKIFGRAVTLPSKLRFSFVPVIGVSIGAAFTPDVLRQMQDWVPSLLALCLFVPLAHLTGYAVFRAGGLPKREAFFGAVPGGLIESVQLGEEAGADVRMLVALQFLRLILTIVTVPLIFWGLTGAVVGSASGAQLAAASVPLGFRDALLMLVAGGVGVAMARALRFPGWIMTGPLCASALLHGLGLVEAAPPGWLVSVTQVILGTGLGARFAGIAPGTLRRAARLAVMNGAAVMALAFAFAGAVHWVSGQPVAASFLAFAPGGLAEMGLIALSLHMSVIYVTAHHVLRIVLAVTFAKIGARWLG